MDLLASRPFDRERVRIPIIPATSGKLLRALNWSVQRPGGPCAGARRGRHPRMEEQAIGRPLKKAYQEGRTIVFIDESGLSQRPHRCRTWAPRGETPVLEVSLWKTISVAAAMTLWNYFVFQKQRSPKNKWSSSWLTWCSNSAARADRRDRLRSPQPLGRRVRLASGRDRSNWSTFPPTRRNSTPSSIFGVTGSITNCRTFAPKICGGLERRGSPYSSQAAPPSTFDHRVLETGFFVRLDIRYIMRDSVRVNPSRGMARVSLDEEIGFLDELRLRAVAAPALKALLAPGQNPITF